MNNARVKLQHKPFLTPIWLTACAAVFALLCALFAIWVWSTANATTVIVIRHAEKALDDPTNPALSETGLARAAHLAQMFDPTRPGGLNAIYVSDTKRSALTAGPLAAHLGLKPVVLPADDARAWVRHALNDHGGGRVLLVAHLDTVPAIVAQLADVAAPKLDENDYGTIFIVTVPRIGRANLLRLHY